MALNLAGYSREIHNNEVLTSELGTFERWISGLMLDPLFFLISRLNYACSPLVINLQISILKTQIQPKKNIKMKYFFRF